MRKGTRALDDNGATAMMHAAVANALPAVKALMEAGANPNMQAGLCTR